MILVRAAAGFGKTTLMQQYAESCAAQQHATVWLRLDAGDNDLERLLVHLDAGLAALSLQQRSDHAAFVTAFSGTHLELGEFLAEDILARQSDACRAFLLETSVLGQLSAPLCDAKPHRSGGTGPRARPDPVSRGHG
ncbi:Regulatory protein, LuxR [Cupriavidus necator H850]|uniref:hypothetical protein n=1 Tax=Cupriavidus necator TaxID=106590 RepID=UPI0002E4B7F7|nr:hypothetical protein [Cupriavidus necator]KAI3599632.1 Regulatory protein, LuxR [Cupriavidus necator H850]MDX6010615.1 hypothetical protein [Cupriavidus necator]